MEPTKEEMRVEIAQDVLKALKTKRINASHNGYMTADDEKLADLASAWEEEDLEALMKLSQEEYSPPKACDVCAIGAVFVAAVDRHDALKLSEVYKNSIDGDIGDDLMLPYLNKWFEDSQLRLMEYAFENEFHGTNYDGPDDDVCKAAEAFYEFYDEPGDRVTAIMNNIIENKGTFIP